MTLQAPAVQREDAVVTEAQMELRNGMERSVHFVGAPQNSAKKDAAADDVAATAAAAAPHDAAPPMNGNISRVLRNTQKKKALLGRARNDAAASVVVHAVASPGGGSDDAPVSTAAGSEECEAILTPHGFHLLRTRDLEDVLPVSWRDVQYVTVSHGLLKVRIRAGAAEGVPSGCLYLRCDSTDVAVLHARMDAGLATLRTFLRSRGCPVDDGLTDTAVQTPYDEALEQLLPKGSVNDMVATRAAASAATAPAASSAACSAAAVEASPWASSSQLSGSTASSQPPAPPPPQPRPYHEEREAVLEWYRRTCRAEEDAAVQAAVEALKAEKRAGAGVGRRAAALARSIGEAHEDWSLRAAELRLRAEAAGYWSNGQRWRIVGRLRAGEAVERVSLARSQLDDAVFLAFLPVLAGCRTLRQLDLSYTLVTDESVAQLCAQLVPTTGLETLILRGCELLTLQSVEMLLAAAQGSTRLKRVHLSRIAGAKGTQALLDRTTMLNAVASLGCSGMEED